MPDSPLPAPGLHVVAVPIGNARDVTLRALDVLRHAPVLACEDTRNMQRLLSLHGIPAGRRLVSYNDHNAAGRLPRLLEVLRGGGTVALASDAGTPLVSDPGYRLVDAALDAGVPVRAVPGPSALTAALSVAGLPTDRALFVGFLPRGGGARRAALGEAAGARASLVVFERADRLAGLLEDIARLPGRRGVAVVREISKVHEETVRGEAADLARRYAAAPPKGEVVVVAGPPRGVLRPEASDIDAQLRIALASGGPSRAAAKVAAATGLPRAGLYERARALSRGPLAGGGGRG